MSSQRSSVCTCRRTVCQQRLRRTYQARCRISPITLRSSELSSRSSSCGGGVELCGVVSRPGLIRYPSAALTPRVSDYRGMRRPTTPWAVARGCDRLHGAKHYSEFSCYTRSNRCPMNTSDSSFPELGRAPCVALEIQPTLPDVRQLYKTPYASIRGRYNTGAHSFSFTFSIFYIAPL
jgi:hypothetical protein